MNKLPCEVVRDLFPSYIDGLTGSMTDQLIEEHLTDCRPCSDVLASMRAPDAEPSGEREEEQKEIDFLKKNKKRNRRIWTGSLIAAVVIICAVLLLRAFVIGNTLPGDYVNCVPQGQGEQLVLDGTSEFDIGRISFTEVDGVVTACAKMFHNSPFHQGSFHAEYTASEPITQVRFNDRILWDEGETISRLASAVYETRHDYMGNASANGRTAQVLNVGSRLGPYTNELHTAQQPYDWTLVLAEDIASADQAKRESDMESLAYGMLAVIGNLDSVTYDYTVEGASYSKTVTTADATAFFGQNIKDCGTSLRQLNDLISETGLDVGPQP